MHYTIEFVVYKHEKKVFMIQDGNSILENNLSNAAIFL